ncbi:MAG: hypothetical protein HQM02_12045, partial [Magnetococcales bacterium]|nr:hypothetical protein [Magnetococcales bacterium]
DSAVAHLTGAMGKPCWVMLPAWGTDWRWMQEREDSPWYPQVMRLLRQREPGEWSDVVSRVADALAEIRGQPHPAADTPWPDRDFAL